MTRSSPNLGIHM